MCPRKDTRRAGAASYPSSGGCVSLEETREPGAALPCIDVQCPGRNVSDHILSREIVASDLGGLTRLAREKRDQRAQGSLVRRNPSRATSTAA
jgi:hypothetical protein